MNIREITIRRCIELQHASCYGAWKAREAIMRSDHTLAVGYQLRTAVDSAAMRSRLDSLNGVDAVVEQRA